MQKTNMISFNDARKSVIKNTPTGKVVAMNLADCLHHILAENVVAPTNAPPFDQSAMDGIAFNFKSWDKKSSLFLKNTIQAGNSSSLRLNKQEAAKIFTGAPIPQGADCVVMKEKVKVSGSQVFILDTAAVSGLNIRKKASHVSSGKVVMRKGDIVTTGCIAFLASIGIAKVKVYAKPRVGIIITGDELTSPGSKLKAGQVYECNSYSLTAGLSNYGITPQIVVHARDEKKDVLKKLKIAEKKSDIILFTGGVSVGEFDFVASVLEENNVKKHFHKVKQKPGKPIYFGVKHNKVYFGLPGNPASVLTCFYVYVLDAIFKWMGKTKRECISAVLLNEYKKKPGLTNLLKAHHNTMGVTILKDQESYKLNTFVNANVLVVMDEDETIISRAGKVLLMEIKN